MTDTLNKNTESCTVCNTPETDAVVKQFEHLMPTRARMSYIAAVARRLERERDKHWQDADHFILELGKAQERMFDAERERDVAIKMFEEIKADALEIQFIKYGYDGCCGSTHIAALIERKCEEIINRIKKQES